MLGAGCPPARREGPNHERPSPSRPRPRERAGLAPRRDRSQGTGARVPPGREGARRPGGPRRLDRHLKTKVGPRNGARVVARAWVDPAYKTRLLADARSAVAELGYQGRGGEEIMALENTPKVHNLVVCTLCSCYPWPVLGLPPVWYKSAPYRSRVVLDPRGVLREFGLEVPDDVEVRVWDSTSEMRYLVLPERPEGTEGMSESALAELVTRDAMIGVARVKPPVQGGRR